jgi:hypothetical protein
MKSKLTLTKRKRLLLATVVTCTVLIASLAILWQSGKVSEAALVDAHPGLMAWWQFNEGTGTVAGDNSTNGNNGTITGTPSWVTGKYGDALSFDGASNYVLSSNAITFGATVTFAAWVKIASFNPSQEGLIVGFNSGQSLNGIIEDAVNGGTLRLYGFGSTIATYSPVNANTWLYVVGVVTIVSSTTVNGTLYVNGVQVDSQIVSGFSGLSTFPSNQITVGAWPFYSYGYVNGTIDEVQTYNRALSATEIQTYYQQSPGFSSNLLAKVPKGTTDFVATLSWQGTGSINVTIQSPSQNYTEDIIHVYQKTTYSASGGTSTMLNIKRLEVSIGALASDQNWNIILVTSNVQDYKITVEVQT